MTIYSLVLLLSQFWTSLLFHVWFCCFLTSIQVSQFSSVQSLIRVLLFVTPWTAACQTSLSITNSQSPLKLMSIESVMPPNYLIPCHPLLLLRSIFPSIRVFSNESVLCITWPKYWCFYYGSNRNETLCPLYTCCKCLLIHPSSGQNKGQSNLDLITCCLCECEKFSWPLNLSNHCFLICKVETIRGAGLIGSLWELMG